jgi:N-acetyltransferase
MQKELFQKYFPDNFTLETNRVLLRLLREDDYELLEPLTHEADIWKYFSVDLSKADELKKWIKSALQMRTESTRMPFLIIDKHDGSVCGSTSYGNISFFDKRLEIGWSWLGTAFMSTGINRNAKFVLLSHAFEAMKMERIEVKTDNLNDRAKAALLKIGMYEEGVLRSHMQMHSNRRRDSVYYSIIREEWPAVKARFFPELA